MCLRYFANPTWKEQPVIWLSTSALGMCLMKLAERFWRRTFFSSLREAQYSIASHFAMIVWHSVTSHNISRRRKLPKVILRFLLVLGNCIWHSRTCTEKSYFEVSNLNLVSGLSRIVSLVVEWYCYGMLYASTCICNISWERIEEKKRLI